MRESMIDTHCHLDLEPLVSHLQPMLQDSFAAGVNEFVVPGVHPGGWQRISSLAAEYPQIFPAFGIHPMHAASADDRFLPQLAEYAPQGIAIGEIGLDPSYSVTPALQEALFREQMRIALKLGLPLLIHCRQAFRRTLQIMREEHADQVGGIMHAFSGSPEMAREFIRLGFAISICGTITWKNAVRPLRLAGEIALEHLVLETDSPDMTPEPYRRRFNRPAWMVETASRLAEIRRIPLEAVAAATTANARKVLRLADDMAA
ncbi:MAG: TatD family hydrolase [Desulfuromonadaceae bacterium]|nr:TatD family hydrolase [Desulfuromonadaceae bacterium]